VKVERLGRVRVYDGAYAVELEERAVERGMTVLTSKTVIKEWYSYDEGIGLSGPHDTWIRRRWAKGRLRNNIDEIVQEEEEKKKPKTVFIMSFFRL
jgi:hypothetical protein